MPSRSIHVAANRKTLIFFHGHPKGDQSWVFIGRTDVEAETPIFWPSDAKSWLTWKDPDAGKDWGQEEKGTTEDEMVGWHHRLNGHGFGWIPGVWWTGRPGVLHSSWGHKQSDMTERLNWTELNWTIRYDLVYLSLDLKFYLQTSCLSILQYFVQSLDFLLSFNWT